MSSNNSLSELGNLLVSSLEYIDNYDNNQQRNKQSDIFYINTAGSKLTHAYEQIRNASEYADDHLFRQRAIRRFLARTLSFHEKTDISNTGEELVTELTLAGYINNGSMSNQDCKNIQSQIKRYYGAYWQYVKIEHSHTKCMQFKNWLLDVLSVRCEQIIQPNIRQVSFTQFAFTYLRHNITKDNISNLTGSSIKPEEYSIILYIAIQQALLKLGQATIRTSLIDSYHQDITIIARFESFNEIIDDLFGSKAVAITERIIKKNGATLKMIYTAFYAPNAQMNISDLESESILTYSLEKHIKREYSTLDKLLDNAIIKSIVFLIITKSIIGLSIEVPYDLIVEGHIEWVPLIINLLFPALFIGLSRFTLTIPNTRNTDTIVDQAVAMIFNNHPEMKISIRQQKASTGFSIAYGILFILAFVGLSYILYLLKFNIVQGIIFVIFLSTASFLVFRMSAQIREIEAVTQNKPISSVLRDIIYLPFIYVGQQISSKYAKMNIIAMTLDMLIEMPLKSVLRIFRQWATFLNNKRDDLL